jgi:hypothetical protein
MLIPNMELKAQIEEFIRSQQLRKRTAAESEIDGATDMTINCWELKMLEHLFFAGEIF